MKENRLDIEVMLESTEPGAKSQALPEAARDAAAAAAAEGGGVGGRRSTISPPTRRAQKKRAAEESRRVEVVSFRGPAEMRGGAGERRGGFSLV